MAKVLVERPRLGGSGKYPRHAERAELDEQPFHEAIVSRRLRDPKNLNENLAPLRRFLRSRLGQPWDAVYSEICQRINRDSAVQLHIWQHLQMEVARDPVRIERLNQRNLFFGWRGFYVDPKTNRLMETQRQKRTVAAAEPFLIERQGRNFKRVNGIWYEIELEQKKPAEHFVWDVLLSRENPARPRYMEPGDLKRRYGRQVYAARKRQLNGREIRRLNLI